MKERVDEVMLSQHQCHHHHHHHHHHQQQQQHCNINFLKGHLPEYH